MTIMAIGSSEQSPAPSDLEHLEANLKEQTKISSRIHQSTSVTNMQQVMNSACDYIVADLDGKDDLEISEDAREHMREKGRALKDWVDAMITRST